MSRYPFRVTLLAIIAFATSCESPSSPVEPHKGSPDPRVDPQVTISASALSLGIALAEASIELRNVGTEPVGWTHSSSALWVSVNPASGSLPAGGSVAVRVGVDRSGLQSGSHTGILKFVFGGVALEVDVNLEVSPGEPMAEVLPASLVLGPADLTAAVDVINAGTAPLNWSFSAPGWIQLQAASGTTAPGSTAHVILTPDRSGLTAGTHAATLTLDSDGGTRTVALLVAVISPPELFVSPGQLNFGSSGTSFTLALANRGGRPLNWTAVHDAGWLALGSDSGTIAPSGARALTLTAERSGLTEGSYSATLSIDSDGGSVSVPVSLTVPAPEPPPPSPPPPSPPPPSGSTALAGRVIEQFGSHGVSGLTVRFAGSTATTDATGAFTVPGSSSGSLRDLVISGSGVYARTTFARSSDTVWRILPASFNMGAFDDMAREYEPRTIRWVRAPNVYIDVLPDGFAGGPELTQWVSEVQSQAASFVSEWTGGTIGAGSVQVGSSPPPDGTPGTIVLHFSEDAAIYGAPSTVGLARTFWSGDRSISSAVVWLRFVRFPGPANAATRRAILGHELGHALGMGHMNGSTFSIMTPNVSSPSLTSFDQDAGFVLYTRSPGNTSPDVDSATTYRGALAPSQAPGYYEWVCGPSALEP